MTPIGSGVNMKRKCLVIETKERSNRFLFRYQQQKAFEALSDEERKTLQNEFDEFRPAAYQAVLEGEVSGQFRAIKDALFLFSLVQKIKVCHR